MTALCRFAAITALGWLGGLIVMIAGGCHSMPAAATRSTVSCNLQQRTGQSLHVEQCSHQVTLLPGASLDDGLTEEEAVTIALWNNAAFQEQLVDLGIARGDLIQAGLLPNPEFVYFFPVTDKPFKYAFDMPIEALWLRPIRVAAAEREVNRTAERLTQAALDLIRDVRQAYADLLLAHERVRISKEAISLRGQVAKIANTRLKAGDATPQEATTAHIDALQAEQEARRAELEIPIVEERLRNLLGLSMVRCPLVLETALPTPNPYLCVESLETQATISRPDALAARQAVCGAQERLRLAKIGWFRFLGILDATSGRDTGHEFGPAFRMTIPIFNWNQGGIHRAEAELEKLVRQQQTLRNLIILEVRRSYAQYVQARAELEIVRQKVRPEVQENIRRAQLGFTEGNASYLIVLESTRQLLDSYTREAQLNADLRRAWAELERSVGSHLIEVAPVPPVSTEEIPPLPVRRPQAGHESHYEFHRESATHRDVSGSDRRDYVRRLAMDAPFSAGSQI